MNKSLIGKNWDYSLQAPFYKFRPNYSSKAIDLLMRYVDARQNKNYLVADVGAGTGNLTILLLEKGLKVVAIEPNDSMRKIGIGVTKKNKNVKWLKANGTETTLKNKNVDWVTFGSSFNVVDRQDAMKEAIRILKSNGYFTCMWNHRDLNDPIQKKAEDIIVKFIPNYDRGVRREDQRKIIEESGLFKDIFYMEMDFSIEQTVDNYINAWRSVRNKYWDLETEDGRKLFNAIVKEIKSKLPKKFRLKYTMRSWTAQKK